MSPCQNPLEFNGHIGSVEWDPIECMFFGKVQNAPRGHCITYQGYTLPELKLDFISAIENYEEFIAEVDRLKDASL